MNHWAVRIIMGLVLVLIGSPARADHFDDHTGAVISKTPQAQAIQKAERLSIAEIQALPRVLAGIDEAGFVVVRTDSGNWSKLLVRHARLRRGGENVDLVLLERLVTYPSDTQRSVLADRRQTYLFGGFWIDLDIGQIVPDGKGADLRFTADPQGASLETASGAEMYLVGRPMVPAASQPQRRVGQASVQPADFAGSYRLDADGRWSGDLVLVVDEMGKVSGTYTSESTGRTYSVSGDVGNPRNTIKFKVALPMTVQEFEGYLWTRDPNKMSGVCRMEGLPFGFLAVRKD